MFDSTGQMPARLRPLHAFPVQAAASGGRQPVRILTRELELRIALTKRGGALVTRDELTSRLWPITMAIGANLSVQMTALRRALRDGLEPAMLSCHVDYRVNLT